MKTNIFDEHGNPVAPVWLLDNFIEMPEHAILCLASDYGHEGDDVVQAVELLRRQGFRMVRLP